MARRRGLTIATTGAQGEPMAGLARMANRDHRFVEIVPGDTVIVSASPIPGNEEYVARTVDNLFKAGANVYYHAIKRAHVSGHASQEELKLMLNLTKPRYIIPIHGEFRMLVQHGRLAADVGVAPENILILENGQPIEFLADGSARRGQPVRGRLRLRGRPLRGRGRGHRAARPAGAGQGRHVPGRGHRRQADTAAWSGEPEVVTRGFVANADEKLLRGAAARIAASIEDRGSHISEVGLLKAQIKDGLSSYLFEQTRRRPLVFPVIVEV